MYTSDIENRQHRSLLEHRRIGIGKPPYVDVVKNSSVVTTTELSPPLQWSATTEPYNVLGGLSGRCFLKTVPHYSAQLR